MRNLDPSPPNENEEEKNHFEEEEEILSHRDSKRLRTSSSNLVDEPIVTTTTTTSQSSLTSQQRITIYHPQPSHQESTILRTSSLAAPTLKLTGHKGSVYSLAFSPDGEFMLSGSFDMTCLLWNSGSGRYENFHVLQGHTNAILAVQFSCDSQNCVTASADSTIAWWDVATGERVKRLVGHEGVVNAIDTSRVHSKLIASAGDDGTARVWDVRLRGKDAMGGVAQFGGRATRRSASSTNTNTSTSMHPLSSYPCTAVAYGADGNAIYVGGIDNCITVYDLRNSKKSMVMKGHEDTITSLALNPKGTHLLSNSMDGTMRTWDIRPFVTTGDGKKRHCKTFVGITHNAEKGLLNCSWSSDGTMVTGGSADRIVHIFDEISSEELYYLPGHTGCVNSVIFHPKENVIASASSDKSIFVGELSN